MGKVIDTIYRGTRIYSGIECDVWEYVYDDGYIWYDLIPTVDAEYEAYLDELFFRYF